MEAYDGIQENIALVDRLTAVVRWCILILTRVSSAQSRSRKGDEPWRKSRIRHPT